jgi:hypothetical protein
VTISIDRLRELLDYDPDTGNFSWRVGRRGGSYAGHIAGAVNRDGYIEIRIDRRLYKAHRLAWFYVNERWPIEHIDHVNGKTGDNRISNLREATNAQNLQNRHGAQANSRSGLIGVTWHKQNERWRAEIVVNGTKKHLGYFETPEQAHAAYLKAKAELHPFQTIVEAA